MSDSSSAIRHRLEGRARDLGEGFVVRRVLPSGRQQMVGSFIFFDHMGPATFAPGPAINVRPHPHIALATVTYLFSGEILHRDSLGSVQEIHPGDVNWMTAGRGIVHSERTTPRSLERGVTLHGIQSWVALPDGHEDVAPAFHHHPAASLPLLETPDGSRLRVIAGEAFGRRSPVATLWPTLYVDAAIAPGGAIELSAEHEDRAVYVDEGEVSIAASDDAPARGGAAPGASRAGDGGVNEPLLRAGELAVLEPAVPARIAAGAASAARVMLLGGARFPTPRLIWWNFVASSRAQLERAQQDWARRELSRFPQVPGDEHEFIPLPDTAPATSQPVR
jgi:redox-sensitive bicupin YhaK (pirin superfamily)